MSWLAYRRHGVLIGRGALVVLFLVVLEAAPRFGWIDPLTVVPLSAMVLEAIDMFRTGEVWRHLIATGSMVLTAFVLATVTGVLIGYLLWRSERAFRMLNPYLTSYYALPIFAFYPALIAIFGLNRTPIILIAWAWAVVAVIVNTVNGFQRVSGVLRKTARLYRLSRWQAVRRVYFPAAAPFVFTGVKLAVTYSIIGVVASEFILAPEGLGWLVSFHYNNFGLEQMYASILLVIAIVAVFIGTVTIFERRIRTVR